VDLSYRLHQLGRLVICPDAVFLHDGGRRPWRSLFWQERCGLAVTAWHQRGPWTPRQVLRAAAGNVVRGEARIGSARLAAFACHVIRPIR
jgi:hypothetical protein